MERFLYIHRDRVLISAVLMVWLLLLVASISNAQSVASHTVQKGDTPWSIAQQYDLSLEKLYSYNPGIEEQALKIGQELNLRPQESTSAIETPTPSTKNRQGDYTIQKGDTWYSLSKRFDVSIAELRALNGAQPILGQSIKLPAEGEEVLNTKRALTAKEAKKELQKEAHAEDGPVIQRKRMRLAQNGEVVELNQQEIKPSPKKEKAKANKGGFGTATEEEEKQWDAVKQKELDTDGETTEYDSEFSLTENRVITPSEAYPDDGTPRIVLVPFDPLLYLSDADEEIANTCGLKRNEVRKYFRRRLNVRVDPKGYETVRLMGGVHQDSVRDLDRIYHSLDYNYKEILEDPESYEEENKNALGHDVFKKNKIKGLFAKAKNSMNGEHQRNKRHGEYSNKFFSVSLKNDEMLEYYNQKYHPNYYVFIAQFEVKTHYRNTQERAANIFTREFVAHYTVLNNKGDFVRGNRVSVYYDSNTKNVKQMVNDNMEKMAKKIMRGIPAPGFTPDPEPDQHL